MHVKVKDRLDAIRAYLNKQSDIQLVFQFGSSLGEQMHRDSDVDIAVLFNTNTDTERILDVRDQLEQFIGAEIDLGILNGASPIFAMQVISNGIEIFNRNSRIRDYFVIRMVNAYYDLKYYRKTQEDNLLKERIFAG